MLYENGSRHTSTKASPGTGWPYVYLGKVTRNKISETTRHVGARKKKVKVTHLAQASTFSPTSPTLYICGVFTVTSNLGKTKSGTKYFKVKTLDLVL